MNVYSKHNKLNINNWIIHINISNINKILKNKAMNNKIINKLIINFNIIDNIFINNEPAIKLIDKRFANVIDWNIFGNNSGKNNKCKNIIISIKNNEPNIHQLINE